MAPSPCAGWTARDVVAHMIQTQREMLNGHGADPGDAPNLDADPAGARRHSALLRAGRSDWFAGLYLQQRASTPVSAAPDVTSQTWVDSVTVMGLGVELGLAAPDPEHAGRVYRLSELDELVGR